jgi:hypothetical protein
MQELIMVFFMLLMLLMVKSLWGYIPPNILGNFRKNGPSSKANSSNAIYGIDGSASVKDIYFDDTPNDGSNNPRWRTIVGWLGGGGKGICP